MPKHSVIGCVSALLFVSDQAFVLLFCFVWLFFRHKSICCNLNIFATRLPPNWRNWLPELEKTFGANKCQPTNMRTNQSSVLNLSHSCSAGATSIYRSANEK